MPVKLVEVSEKHSDFTGDGQSAYCTLDSLGGRWGGGGWDRAAVKTTLDSLGGRRGGEGGGGGDGTGQLSKQTFAAIGTQT